MKRFFTFAFLCGFTLTLMLSACSIPDKPDVTSRTGFALGTIVSITVYGENGAKAEKAIDEAFKRVAEIEKICAYTDPDSELSRLNANAYREAVAVSEELYLLTEAGLTLSKKTHGAFDITLGALIDLWSGEEVPDGGEIGALLPFIGYRNVTLDGENRAVSFKNPHIKLHLGGIAKGYAAEEAAAVLRENGVGSAMIDLGGDNYVFGDSPRKDGKWLIGIANPKDRTEIAETIEIGASNNGTAVMTSGNYERFFERNGKRYHHILDPETGYPSEMGIASVTVIGIRGTDTDAYATAFFVMGADKAFEFSETEGVKIVVIDEEGKIRS